MVRLFNNSDKIMNFYINSTLLDNIAEEGAGTGVYNIKIYKQGEGDNDYSLLYDGMIGSGNNDILVSDQLLATLSGGESAGIKIIETLDGESMDNSYMNKQGQLEITVNAEQPDAYDTVSNNVITAVKTGDSNNILLYIIVALAGIAGIAGVVVMRQRNRQ
jgi:LPXTG-motif cell wall-anchored protein